MKEVKPEINLNKDHNNSITSQLKNIRKESTQKVFNQHLNDTIFLNYDEEKELPMQLYNRLPQKLSIFKIIKYRNTIGSFIKYQTNLYASTYVERKILKQTKQVNAFIILFTFITFIILFIGYKQSL